MLTWLATLGTCVLTTMVAYVLARVAGLTAPAIDRDVASIGLVVVSQVGTWSLVPVTWAASTSLAVLQMTVARPRRLVFLLVVTGLAVAMHYEHQRLAPVLDRFWRCGVGKAFDDFFMPLVQVVRLLYAMVIPVVNFGFSMVAQVVRGTPIIIAKCQISELLAPVTHLSDAAVHLFQALGAFFGAGAPITPANNLAVNEFELEPAARSGLLAVAALKSGIQCACSSLEDVTNIVFRVLESPNLAKAVDHGAGVAVRAVQMLLRIVVPPHEAPRPERVLYHAYGATITTALALDDGVAAIVQNVVRIFAPKTTIRAPKEFLFTALARLGVGEYQRLVALFALGPWSVTVPDQWSDSQAMMARWRPDEAYSNLYTASYDAGVVVQWVVYLAENLIAGLTSEGKALTPQPTALDCDWGRDLNDKVSWPKGAHFLSYTAGCSVYYAGRAWYGWQHVLHAFVVEMFFTTWVRQEQSFLRLVQKYDGMWASRRGPMTCATRRDAATPVGHVALDWSVDAAQCRCDMHLGSYHAPDPNARTYDPAEVAAFRAYETFVADYEAQYNVSGFNASLVPSAVVSFHALEEPDRAYVRWVHGEGRSSVVQVWRGLTHLQREIWEDVFAGRTAAAPAAPTTEAAWDLWTRLSPSAREALEHNRVLQRLPPPPDGRDAVYNPWCGQPTLQHQVFDALDGLLVHVLHGLFGPTGIGELLSEVQPDTVPPFSNAKAFAALLGVPLPSLPTFPTYTRIYVEGARVATRVLLSLPDIFDLRWAFYDINCGYGLNATHLVRRWNSYYRGESVAWRDGDTFYVEEGGQQQVLTREELRWRICEARGYQIPKVTDGRDFDFDTRSQLCGDNSQAGCMCNYNLRLERDAPCQCIAHYPEETALLSPDTEVQVRERFTSAAVSSRWCNKLAAEWFFYHASVVTDALVWMLQLGPVNEKKCGVAGMAGKAPLFDDTRETRLAESWVAIPTTESFLGASEAVYYNVLSGEVADAYDGPLSETYTARVEQLLGGAARVATLAEYTALVEGLTQQDVYEGPGPYVETTAETAPAGEAVFPIIDVNVSMGGGDFDPAGTRVYETALHCVQEQDARARRLGTTPDLSQCTEQATGAREDTCRVYGNTDFTCATGLALRTSATGLLFALRRVTEGALGVFGGDVFGIDLDPTAFLCLYTKFIGAQASLLPSFVFFLSDDLKQRLTKLLFGASNLLLVTAVKVSTSINWFLYKNMAKVVEVLMQGRSVGELGDEVKQGVNEAVVTVVRLVFDGGIVFCDMTADFFDLWGAGDFFRTIGDVIRVVQDALTGVLLDFAGLFMELVARTFAILSGKTDVGEYIDLFLKLMFGIAEILLQQAGQVLGLVLKLMGPVGTFIKDFATGACNTLNDILCGLQQAACFGTCGCQKVLTCVQLRSSHRRLSSIHDLFAEGNVSATRWVHDNTVWNGTSLCDHFMDAIRDTPFTELRPLERAQWYECLEMRAIGIEVDLLLPGLGAQDLFYNWRRKWIIGQGLTYTAVNALNLWWRQGRVTDGALRTALLQAGIPADAYVDLFVRARRYLRHVGSQISWDQVADRVLGDLDPTFRDPFSTSVAARLYRIQRASARAYDGASQTWHAHHGARAFHKLAAASVRLPGPSLAHLPHVLRTGGTTLWHRAPAILQRPRRRFRAPVRTNITRTPPTFLCPDPEASFCFECALLDNFIDQAVVHGNAVGDFYGTVFGAPTVTSKRACVRPPCRGIAPDVVHYFDGYFKNVSTGVADTLARLGSYRVAEAAVNRWERVGADWARVAAANVSVDEAIDAFARFVETANDTYVPFTGYGLPYAVTYPIVEACAEEALFSYESTMEERVKRIDGALLGLVVAFLVIYSSSVWSYVPFGSIAGSTLGLTGGWFVYLYVVYGWLPTCAPTLPYFLMEDLTVWLRTRADPGCFCTMFPELTESFCRTSTCDVCFVEKVARYDNCLATHPIMTDWSIFWSGPFLLRWWFPGLYGVFVEHTDLFDGDSSISALARAAYEQPDRVDPHMLECFWMTSLNVPINLFAYGLALYVGASAAVHVAALAAQVALFAATGTVLLARIALSLEIE